MGRGTMEVTVGLSLTLLAVEGCNRPNLAYGDGSEDGTGPSVTSGRTSGPGDSGAPSDTGATGVTDSADETGQGPGTGESTGDSETGDVACDLHPPAGIPIDLFNTEGEPVPPDSPGCNEVLWLDDGMLWIEGNEIHLRPCFECNCTLEGESYRLQLGNVIPPPLPECGHIGLWESPTDDGCRWGGMVLFIEGENTIPDFVVSNQRNLPSPPLVSSGVAVGLEPVSTCELPAACPNDPGRYALTFGPSTVEVGPAQLVEVPFVAGIPFLVTNRMSSIAPNCSERVAWVGEIDL